MQGKQRVVYHPRERVEAPAAVLLRHGLAQHHEQVERTHAGRLQGEVKRPRKPAAVADALHRLGAILQAADLLVAQPRRGQHLIRRVGRKAHVPMAGAKVAAVNQLQEAQLQLMRPERVRLVERLREGGVVLLRQAGDQVDVQVNVAHAQQLAQVAFQSDHVRFAMARFERLRMERLQPRFHLEQPSRRGAQKVERFPVKQVCRDLQMIAHAADFATVVRINQAAEQVPRAACAAVERAVDQLDRVAAHLTKADEHGQRPVLRQELYALPLSGQAEGTGKGAPAARFGVNHASIQRGVPCFVVEIVPRRRRRGDLADMQAGFRPAAHAAHGECVFTRHERRKQRRQRLLARAADDIIARALRERFLRRPRDLRATKDDDDFRPCGLQAAREQRSLLAIPDIHAKRHSVGLCFEDGAEDGFLGIVDVQVADGRPHLRQRLLHGLFQAKRRERHVDILACQAAQRQVHIMSAPFRCRLQI